MKKICLIVSIWSSDYLESICEGIRARIHDDKEIRVDIYVGFDIDEWNGISLKKEREFYDIINPSFYDGALVAIGGYNLQEAVQKTAKKFMDAGLPVVTIESPIEGAPMVKADNYDAFYHIVEHIVRDHKCRRFNFIGGPKDARDANARYKAFMDCCTEYSIRLGDISAKFYYYAFEDGKRAYEDFKAEGKQIPDAVICANDAMARGYLEAAAEDGYSAPKDFIISGFDNELQSQRYMPSITTVDVNLSDSSGTAIELLLKRIDGEEIDMLTKTKEKICCRQSCGCIPINSYSEENILALHKAQDMFDNRNLNNRIALQGISKCASVEDLHHNFFYYVDNVRAKRSGIALNTRLLKGNFDTIFNDYDEEMVMVSSGGIYEINRKEGIYPKLIDSLDDTQLTMLCPIYFENSTFGYGCFALVDTLYPSMNRRSLSGMLGIAIESMRQNIALNRMNSEIEKINKQLRELSTTDALTGLYNRLAYAQLGEGFYEENHGNVYFLYIDMDRLKYINDNCGHNVGNVAIMGIANGIKEFFGDDTLRFRMGGDEFLVIGKLDSEDVLVDKISKLDGFLKVCGEENKLPIPLTASMGYVLGSSHEKVEFEEMVNRADAKMYEVKMAKKRV